jgi:serine phosphatase RsbU (regulator of sigma subunit)
LFWHRGQAGIQLGLKSGRELQQVLRGDFFQIIPMQDGAMLVILGDVSGNSQQAVCAIMDFHDGAKMRRGFCSSYFYQQRRRSLRTAA